MAKCWSDPQFKKRLMSDPNGTLEAEGITLPKGIQFKVHEDTEQKHHLFIPEKPSRELSEEELETIAAGALNKISDIGDFGSPA
ncbi:MAG: NHLP leader peptide family RiPP precursor [Chlamydiales bacterium]|nr:NHLP leader peptide family RiPP precursor [Chlamydiales bacterium]